MNLDTQFWNGKYSTSSTGWDIGYISTPIKEYIDQLIHLNQRILIPGAGNSYEAEYLHNAGFTDVHILDFSIKAIENFTKRVSTFPTEHVHCENFFSHKGQYDLVLEQTFFCALDKSLRAKYVNKMHSLLNVNGKLAGLLFDHPMKEDCPPFGGDIEEYNHLFTPLFQIKTLETAYNSIKPRQGKEAFFIFEKRM